MLDRIDNAKKWIDPFLNKLSETGQVTKAAKYARVSRMTAYNERAANPEFAAKWEAALQLGIDALEDEGLRRAFDGSDTMLIFMLKTRRPDVYRDVSRQLNYNVDVSQMSDDELRAILQS